MLKNSSSDFYFEDMAVGFRSSSGPYLVSEEEILEFGRRFDPRPFHTDPIAAKDSVFGGLVAPGSLTFAIRAALVGRLEQRPVYLAGLGLENMDLPNPVRPSDQLFLTIECLDRRESASRPEAGIIRFGNTMINQHNDIVLHLIAKVMVAKKYTFNN